MSKEFKMFNIKILKMRHNCASICNLIYQKVNTKLRYFGEKSSLHGIGYVFSRNDTPIHKRIFWLLILILCCFGALVILHVAMNLYMEDSVSYSVETNYLDWDTPFPALTICEQVRNKELKAFLIERNIPTSMTSFMNEVTWWNKKYCETCVRCKINQTCFENFQQVVAAFRVKCSGLLTKCFWNGQPFQCCKRFHPIQTEYGVCFVFNSRVTNNESKILTVNRRVGLPSLVFTANEDISIRIHSSDDIVSAAMENLLVYSTIPLVTDLNVILKAELTVNDISVHSVSRDIRGCLFEGERPAYVNDWPFRRYSYSACVLYCRNKAQMNICNCTHHFMPKIGNNTICDIKGLICLNKNKKTLENVECDCPVGCEEVLYKIIHVFFERQSRTLLGSRCKFQLANLPTQRDRRYAVRDMLRLVVDIGGVGGVFFGASLLSVIEIIYLFCIRRVD